MTMAKDLDTPQFASKWLRDVAYNAYLEARIAGIAGTTEKEDLIADLIDFSEGLTTAAHDLAREVTGEHHQGHAVHYLVAVYGTAKIRTKWRRLRELSR